MVLILAIETSCDESAAALVEGTTVLSNVVASQRVHESYGGVVPELASRAHLQLLSPVIDEALKEAGRDLREIDAIAVAEGPGLIGSLLVGINCAKGLALSLGKPLIFINHVQAHLYSPLVAHPCAPFPAVGLVISGGHTSLYHLPKQGEEILLGKTRDDAVGEAFDKVGALLDLPYPGGPHIEQLAKKGNPHAHPFRGGQVKNRPLDFSFSGLKTALLYKIKGQNGKKVDPSSLSLQEKQDLAASFQQAAIDDLLTKTTRAITKVDAKSLLVGGGVCQNQTLRETFKTLSIPVYWPPKGLSTDNAAMIGALASYKVL